MKKKVHHKLSKRKSHWCRDICIRERFEIHRCPKRPKSIYAGLGCRSIHEKNAHPLFIGHKKGKRIHRFIPASSWHPLSAPSLDLENYLKSTRLELSKTKIINTQDNLTKPEHQALISLRKKKHLVFQKPDKSRGVVIINKHGFIYEGETMLKGNQYTEIYADMTSETVNLVKKQLYLMLCDESIDQTHKTTYTLKNIKFEHHIAIFYRKFTKLSLPCRTSLCWKKHSLKLWGPMRKKSANLSTLLTPPCTKSIYILEGHQRRDKKNWAIKNSKTLSSGDNWLYWDVH